MYLPIRFLLFWYPNAVQFFILLWKNVISFIEEDLAVGLMIRLIFVPLFHDSSVFGHIISFFFRLFRIITGFFAYFISSVLLLFIVIIWFLTPVLVIPSIWINKILFLILISTFIFGFSLFVHILSQHKPKKVSQVKNAVDVWSASIVKKSELNWQMLLGDDEVRRYLQSIELDPGLLVDINPPISDGVLDHVMQLAKSTGAIYITPVYFFIIFFMQSPNYQYTLLKINLTQDDIFRALQFLEMKRNHWRRVMIWDDDFAVKHLRGTNRGWLSAPTPNLDIISSDLTRSAAKQSIPEFIGRKDTFNQVISILSQGSEKNVLLVGAPGSGKSTLVQNLAAMIIAGNAPDALSTKRIVEIDFARLMANVTSEGDLAAKVQQAFEEVQYIEDIIIFVDEIQNLGIGDAGANYNIYSLVLPYLESNRFQFVASTEAENYTKIIEKNGSFARLFHKVDVPPASIDETIELIEKRAIELARFNNIDVTYLAIKTLTELCDRFVHDRVLPDSALGMLKECEPMAVGGQITSAGIKQAMQNRIQVPIVELDESHKKTLLNLEDIIHESMIDQAEAVKVVSDTLRRASTALREGNRPIGSFLFVGPTGVGKTELAKILAKTYFKSENAFLSFDMSEYQNSESVNRLIGGAENPGELTEAVRHKPYALLLLDEFEKANPQILTLFLQVLEEGRLTDFSGKHIDFTNTIIIATSNVGSVTIAQQLLGGEAVEQVLPIVKNELLKQFKPELINRFDEVVIFKPLSKEDLQKIVQIKLIGLQNQLKQQGYLVEFTPDVVSTIAQRAYDPSLGARPMRRFIQDTLEANLSKKILANELIKGEISKIDASLLIS